MTIDRKVKTKIKEQVGPISFSVFMRAARTSMDLTQEEFGKRLGISRANVCDIEKGRHLVSAELAVKVARKVGLPEKYALQACLQDQVRRTGVDAEVKVS
jgi:DNA-binding XRE family transcriptional regulator